MMRRFSLDSLLSSAAGMSAPVAKRIVLEAVSHIGQGSLSAELPGGEVRHFGVPGREPSAAIRVRDEAAFGRVLTGGEIAAGETYMDGLWDSPDLTKLLELGILNREHAPPMVKRLNDLSRSASRALHLSRSNTRDGSRDNVRAHYDLGNDFFRLFLDETLTYSCAVFEAPGQPLAEAQRNRYRTLCQKASLAPGDHVLEIGPVGGFAIHAAQNYGCRVTTIRSRRSNLPSPPNVSPKPASRTA